MSAVLLVPQYVLLLKNTALILSWSICFRTQLAFYGVFIFIYSYLNLFAAGCFLLFVCLFQSCLFALAEHNSCSQCIGKLKMLLPLGKLPLLYWGEASFIFQPCFMVWSFFFKCIFVLRAAQSYQRHNEVIQAKCGMKTDLPVESYFKIH